MYYVIHLYIYVSLSGHTFNDKHDSPDVSFSITDLSEYSPGNIIRIALFPPSAKDSYQQ
jgi:hypothetical protein